MKHIFYTALFFSFFISSASIQTFHKQDLEIEKSQSKLTFWEACETGDLARVREIIHRNPESINTMDENGDTGLHLAIIHEQTAIAEYLITHGADINLKGMIGMTSLQLALLHNNKVLIKLLLEQATLDTQATDRHGMSTEYYLQKFLPHDLAIEILLTNI